MQGEGTRIPAGLSDEIGQVLMAERPQVLLKVQGAHGDQVHLAHGKEARTLADGGPQQAVGSNHVVLGRTLAEVLERGDGLGATLHLIKEDQGRLRINARREVLTKKPDKPLRLDASGKKPQEVRVLGEVDMQHGGIVGTTELEDGVGLAHLPRPHHHEGLAVI